MGDRPFATVVTPPGLAAVALIEVVGADAGAVVERLLGDAALPAAGRSAHRWLVDATGARLDDALVVAWGDDASPRVELGVHGGPAVVAAVLDALAAAGAAVVPVGAVPPALVRAGVCDPITASAWRRVPRVRTVGGVRVLADALSGALQRAVHDAVDRGGEPLERLIARSARARGWFRPVRAVLVGRPNAGKSSLFNALLGRERATVSAEVGTTRDAVDDEAIWNDRVVRLVDTAGDAPPAGRLARADVVVAVGGDPTPRPPGARIVRVASRVDVDPIPAGFAGVATSARTGEGIEALRHAIAPAVEPLDGPAAFAAVDRRLLAAALGGDPGAARAVRRRAGSPDAAARWRLFSGREND